MVDLTVIIVNWNTKDLLQDCIQSVYDFVLDISFEVIVVDNASTDGSVDMVEQQFPQVKLVANEDNKGFVEANNQASRIANGEFILLLNSDAKFLASGAAEVLEYMRRETSVGIVTGEMFYEDGEFQPPYRRFPGLFSIIERNTLRKLVGINFGFQKRYLCEDLDPKKAQEVEWATGAYIYLRKDLLDEGNVFDRSIFMYYEDTLLCRRVKQLGYRVMYLPKAPVVHYRDQSGKQVKVSSTLYSFRSSVRYIAIVYGSFVSALYRFTVRSIWILFGVVLSVVPKAKYQDKSKFFFSLYKTEPE